MRQILFKFKFCIILWIITAVERRQGLVFTMNVFKESLNEQYTFLAVKGKREATLIWGNILI